MIARLILVTGALLAAFGIGLGVPALQEYLTDGSLPALGPWIVSLSGCLIVGGCVTIGLGWSRRGEAKMPAPVRATVLANILFLAFCVLELSDGLLRRDGRIFYWTTVLFPPALALLCGLVAAHRWAWWVTRIAAILGVLWFATFIVLLPFVSLHTDGVPVPWQGRVYMAGVSLVFASIAAYAFRLLGQTEARSYFGRRSAA